MHSLWKRHTAPPAQPYRFPTARELLPPEPEAAPEPPAQTEPEATPPAPPVREEDPIGYAQVQAEAILAAARQDAREMVDAARAAAQQQRQEIEQKAREEGFAQGREEGIAQGTQQALQEGRRERDEQLQALSGEVAAFLEKAGQALDAQLDENIDQLKDLAIAVAEKVIAVSLKSSSEVVGRMIQAAVDRRKRREWVRIYVAECDGQMLKMTPALEAALQSLSDQVRIIPMADDEPGTCIIEMPDEIVDASAATQLANIRSLLSDIPAAGPQDYPEGGVADHVPLHDPPGLSG